MPSSSPLSCDDWPAWTRFKDAYVEASGRVIDYASDRRITVSEGQAYGMFFALVANDRPGFERMLQWTEDNLAAGSLRTNLPAWHWGRRDDGSWGVLDSNSASDADLWLAYTLAQAHRRWGSRRYGELSRSLAHRVLKDATTHVPGLGLVLLPAPVGFGPTRANGKTRVRLNPSYLPLSMLTWWSRFGEDDRWQQLLESSIQIVGRSAINGFAPDWLTLSADAANQSIDWAVQDGSEEDRWGSYDAIRVYLWLGLMPSNAPHRSALMAHFSGMARSLSQTGLVPEKVNLQTGEVLSASNPGLGWALLPYLKNSGRETEFQTLASRLNSLPPRFPAYYENALMLFASGYLGRRYRFDGDGSLELGNTPCSNAAPTPSSVRSP